MQVLSMVKSVGAETASLLVLFLLQQPTARLLVPTMHKNCVVQVRD